MIELIYFTAAWCTPCKMFGPVVDTIVREKGVSIMKVDADISKETVKKFNIGGLPTIVFFKNGNEIARRTGVMSKSQLSNLIDSL
jgi:thioredoxin 1